MMMTLGRPGLLMVCAWTIVALRAQTQARKKMNRVGFITIIYQFSEEELQPELQLPIRSACASDAEPARAQRIAWQTELWRVERIEHLEAELQAELFAEREVLQRRRVEIDSPRPGQHCARSVAISKTRWRRKGSRIEPLNPAHSARRRFAFLRIWQPPVADDIGPQILAVGVEIGRASCRERGENGGGG